MRQHLFYTSLLSALLAAPSYALPGFFSDAERAHFSSDLKRSIDDESPAAIMARQAADRSGRWRPQIHFSPPAEWLNDPNGLFVDSDGVWHMYYQCESFPLPPFPPSHFNRPIPQLPKRKVPCWKHLPKPRLPILSCATHCAGSGRAVTNVCPVQCQWRAFMPVSLDLHSAHVLVPVGVRVAPLPKTETSHAR